MQHHGNLLLDFYKKSTSLLKNKLQNFKQSYFQTHISVML